MGGGEKPLPLNRPQPKADSVTGHSSVVAVISFLLGVRGLTFSTCINSLTCTFPVFCKWSYLLLWLVCFEKIFYHNNLHTRLYVPVSWYSIYH